MCNLIISARFNFNLSHFFLKPSVCSLDSHHIHLFILHRGYFAMVLVSGLPQTSQVFTNTLDKLRIGCMNAGSRAYRLLINESYISQNFVQNLLFLGVQYMEKCSHFQSLVCKVYIILQDRFLQKIGPVGNMQGLPPRQLFQYGPKLHF